MQIITLVPIGGLANRMRAMMSAISLSKNIGAQLQVVWVRDSGLNARFAELFQDIPCCNILEVTPIQRILQYSLPRKRNFHLPRLYQKCSYDTTLYEDQMQKLREVPAQLEEMLRGKSSLLITGIGFYPSDDSQLKDIFLPQPPLLQLIEERKSLIGDNCIGLHIRRTDNIQAIAESPIALFEEEIESSNASNIYLATDDEKTRRYFKEKYGEVLFTSNNTISRDTPEGIQEAVIEMYTLATTRSFAGSYYSSYSDAIIALRGNGKILKKHH